MEAIFVKKNIFEIIVNVKLKKKEEGGAKGLDSQSFMIINFLIMHRTYIQFILYSIYGTDN